jgi:hypothetical protein
MFQSLKIRLKKIYKNSYKQREFIYKWLDLLYYNDWRCNLDSDV